MEYNSILMDICIKRKISAICAYRFQDSKYIDVQRICKSLHGKDCIIHIKHGGRIDLCILTFTGPIFGLDGRPL